jgi:hypothetical protein
MSARRIFLSFLAYVALLVSPLCAQAPSSSSSAKVSKPVADSAIEAGGVSNGIYRNKSLVLSCKIPEGWVLRTEEMNAREDSESGATKNSQPQRPPGGTEEKARVLLAAFSRPPEARGNEVNASIVIAAESVATYPGLTEAVQYFGPLTEVATAQGFAADEDPYEIAIGPKTLVREDFHKNVGTRVMRQSTLVMLARGYAVSITVIGGSEDEVADLIDGLDFTSARK